MDSKYVEVTYGAVTPPETSVGLVPVDLTADTWNERLQKIRSRMKWMHWRFMGTGSMEGTSHT